MGDEEGETKRIQQQKQHRMRSQMQQEEAALEGHGVAGEPAGGGAPLGGVHAAGAQEEYEEWVGSWGGKQRRWLRREEGLGLKGGEGVKVSLPVSVTTDNLV